LEGERAGSVADLNVAVADAFAVQILEAGDKAEEELAGGGGWEDTAREGAPEALGLLVVVHGDAALQILRRGEEGNGG